VLKQKFEDIFSCLDTIYQCNLQTDIRWQQIPRIASHGKNGCWNKERIWTISVSKL